MEEGGIYSKTVETLLIKTYFIVFISYLFFTG